MKPEDAATIRHYHGKTVIVRTVLERHSKRASREWTRRELTHAVSGVVVRATIRHSLWNTTLINGQWKRIEPVQAVFVSVDPARRPLVVALDGFAHKGKPNKARTVQAMGQGSLF